jgi:hypothetical protein
LCKCDGLHERSTCSLQYGPDLYLFYLLCSFGHTLWAHGHAPWLRNRSGGRLG